MFFGSDKRLKAVEAQLVQVGADLKSVRGVLDRVQASLAALQRLGERIMATEQQLLDTIKKIDEATTKQGQVLQAEADTLRHISDDVDKLLVQIRSGQVSDSTLASLQAQADKIQAISDSLDKQAQFSKDLATKADNPVPAPVPNPTP
jgi:uncharacterized protein YoxC